MYKEKVVSIVVPAHNEQKLIQKVLKEIPHWVDYIFVIDDFSKDSTSDKVKERSETDSRIVLIRHEKNKGVGGAICTGYKASLEADVDTAVVMAGDAQMDPTDLEDVSIAQELLLCRLATQNEGVLSGEAGQDVALLLERDARVLP